MRELWAWMNGEHVGAWSRGRSGNHRFTYEPSWLLSPRVRCLSLSMPIAANREVSGEVVANYFDNLLPDDERIRKRLVTRFKTKSNDAFALLEAIGRDCVGAVQLLPPNQQPTDIARLDYEKLTDIDVEKLLENIPVVQGLASHHNDDKFRISIAGAQEKTALLRVGEQWCSPRGATPTSHILKLPLGRVGGRRLDLMHSVENEWLCAQILEFLGLPVATTTIARFGNQKTLVVERFDRQWQTDNWLVRLPQEDFCQALGKPSQQKYQNQGGPGIAEILSVLKGGDLADMDVCTFLCTQLAFWLLAATDGHAKNFSIFLLPQDRYRLTPLYDVLSSWPVIGAGPNKLARQDAKLAMGIKSKNMHYAIDELQSRHWHQIAVASGVEAVWAAMLALVNITDEALTRAQAKLPSDFPAQTAEAIFNGVRTQADKFRGGLASL